MSSTEKPDTTYNVDPICLFHHLRQSEHYCLVCCLCFTDMTIQEALETGADVCKTCKKITHGGYRQMKQKAYKARVLKEQTYELLVSYYTADGVEWATLSAHKRLENGATYETGQFKIPAVLLRQLASDL